MAPKKKEVQKLSLNEFMKEPSYGGSWADEVEDSYASGTQPLPPSDRDRRGTSGFGGYHSERASYPQRDSFPQRLPDKPPFTAHLGNLSYDATQDSVTDFFSGCEIISIRIVEDREQQRPKGFGYAEFATVDGLKKALTLDGSSFEGRSIRIRIADPPKDRENRMDSGRELDWSQRRGPLADIPRANDRRSGPAEFGERRAHREPVDDGKSRDFSDWTRRGPLSPRAEPVRQSSSRDGSRPPNEGARSDSYNRNNRRTSPAAWGEGGGRQQDGSRPPRREFADRPERPERVPTAAERDMQWRNNMRPDPPAKSPGQSRSGSEAPPSPAPAAAVPASAPAGRPKLQLAKRTVSDAPDVTSPALTATDSKASPFGAARPIDTAAREREIEEKRLAALKEKKEVEEKAKEERRLAKEAAAAKAAEEALVADAKEAASEEKPENDAPPTVEAEKDSEEARSQPAENGATAEQKMPIRPREQREPRENREPREHREPREGFKSRATESGNWRSSGEHRGPRGAPTGPRRGGGASRGARQDTTRPSRANGSGAHQSQPSTPVTGEPDSVAQQEEDGWTTVKKTGRGGRAIVS